MTAERVSKVVAVSISPRHSFQKKPQLMIQLLAGLGVEGDAHCGATVKHRYLARRHPGQPNRMQVHLLQVEFLEDLHSIGFDLEPGDLGENITTSGLDLLQLPCGTLLHLGPEAVVELTGLRTPCAQMNRFRAGLMTVAFSSSPTGKRRPRAGVMAVVRTGGSVQPSQKIEVELPALPHRQLLPI